MAHGGLAMFFNAIEHGDILVSYSETFPAQIPARDRPRGFDKSGAT